MTALDESIAAAVAALTASGLVVYPTETVYGLGADAGSEAALQRLIALKGRDAGKGISVLVADLDAARTLIAGPIPQAATRLADAFWPGPLTLVLAAAAGVSRSLQGATGGVGLRCSSDPLCRALVGSFGRPLTSTSANPAGRPPATTAFEARAYFADAVDVYLDGGIRRSGGVSTVVEFRDGCAYLRRAGAVSAEALASIVPLEQNAPAVR